eukprot:TRINITY_DN26565_c0_g1_i1.p1 TRINITY_DN26565_c0_g1~~TRINITY_DN26565_c0_g1_i1.p1  ORF type:complete len:428 (+),score=28.18 TRINITY_DN26565_c0_g1_i1:53-1336(+)
MRHSLANQLSAVLCATSLVQSRPWPLWTLQASSQHSRCFSYCSTHHCSTPRSVFCRSQFTSNPRGLAGRLHTMKMPLLGQHAELDTKGHASAGNSKGVAPTTILLCAAYVLLSMSGPILLDWVRRNSGGTFRFNVPSLTFNAYGIALIMGILWASCNGQLDQLYRPDMLLRFGISASLFSAGDILNFLSLKYLDTGTFSLLGKALGIILTVTLTRLLLGKRQTRLQYGFLTGVAISTVVFCQAESYARGQVIGGNGSLPLAAGARSLGFILRSVGVTITSFAVVLQERFFTRKQAPFMLQQFWMACGACTTSLVALKLLHGFRLSQLVRGFDDWRVLLMLTMYTAYGLTTGLMVKRLGALAKALCLPVYLGGCYAYAVLSGSTVLSTTVVLAWTTSASLLCAFTVSKAMGQADQKQEMRREPGRRPV